MEGVPRQRIVGIGKVENKLKPDKRMSMDPSCIKEPPFDLVASKSDHAYLHAITKLTIRTYILEIFLKCLPVMEKIYMSSENIDNFLPSMVYNLMLEGVKSTPEELIHLGIVREKYWYLLLEQMVQCTERSVLFGEITKDEELTTYLDELTEFRNNFREISINELRLLQKIKNV